MQKKEINKHERKNKEEKRNSLDKICTKTIKKINKQERTKLKCTKKTK